MQSVLLRNCGRLEQYYDATSVFNRYPTEYTDYESWIAYLREYKKEIIRIVNGIVYIEKSYTDKHVITPAKSVVYFIMGGDHLIKIGTTRSMGRRMREIFTVSPISLRLVKTIPGDFKVEKEIHTKFKKYHYKGEWFFYSEEIKEFINGHGSHPKKET